MNEHLENNVETTERKREIIHSNSITIEVMCSDCLNESRDAMWIIDIEQVLHGDEVKSIVVDFKQHVKEHEELNKNE